MVKLVFLSAVGSAALAPCWKFVDAGVMPWQGGVAMGGVAVPMAQAVAAFVIVRNGPFRDWLIRVFLAVSTSVAFGVAVYFARPSFGLISRRTFLLIFLNGMALPLPAGLVLALALVALLRRVIPRPCPSCRRFALIFGPAAREPEQQAMGRLYDCLGCGGQFRKSRGAWESVLVEPQSTPVQPIRA
jgi:hypothetical protein